VVELDLGLQVQTAGYREAAAGLRALADKGVTNAVRRGLRSVAKPLGQDMIAGGAAQMPHRGGLSDRVAQSKVSLRIGMTGGNPSVEIQLAQRQGYQLGDMDKGKLRHPVFERHHSPRSVMHKGRRRRVMGPRMPVRWVGQTVPAKAFTTPFEQGAPKVRAALVREVQSAVNKAMGGS
jgi:hypothetical protein